jgi:hypothetical protein
MPALIGTAREFDAIDEENAKSCYVLELSVSPGGTFDNVALELPGDLANLPPSGRKTRRIRDAKGSGSTSKDQVSVPSSAST